MNDGDICLIHVCDEFFCRQRHDRDVVDVETFIAEDLHPAATRIALAYYKMPNTDEVGTMLKENLQALLEQAGMIDINFVVMQEGSAIDIMLDYRAPDLEGDLAVHLSLGYTGDEDEDTDKS